MQRIINTFKYGSTSVKMILLATIVAGAASLASLVAAIVFGHLLWFFAAIFLAFVAVSLAQTFGIKTEDDDYLDLAEMLDGFVDNLDNEKSTNLDAEKSSDNDMDDDTYDVDEIGYAERKNKVAKIKNKKSKKDKNNNIKAKKDKIKTNITKKDNTDKNKANKDKTDKIKENNITKKEKLDNNKTKKDKLANNITKKDKLAKEKIDKKKVTEEKTDKGKSKEQTEYKKQSKTKVSTKKKFKTKKLKSKYKKLKPARVNSFMNLPKVTAKPVKLDIKKISSSDIAKDNEKQRPKNVAPEKLSVESVKQYNKKKMKKIMHQYKVKREHKLVMVDRCDKYQISQTPAFVWMKDDEFHVLLIEKEPRQIVLSRLNLGCITYLKKQPVDINIDYEAFNVKSILTDLFRPYLPDYNQSSSNTDLNYYKNLYGIGPGIYFTNTSAKTLIDYFGYDLSFEDKVTTSKRVNYFFKDVYKANILVRDNVLDANGYADRISSILEDMVMSSISYNEFKENINLMIKNKFITKEFGVHYLDLKDKRR